MTPDFTLFGDPSRFEIALRWRGDMEPRARRPSSYGWSTGDMRITVAGSSITGNARGAARQSYVSWYLLPVATWLAENWGSLLHEAEFAWAERSSAPAAAAVLRRMHSLIDARDPQAREDYRRAQVWRTAHALSSAASGGLLPNLFLRRYLDSIELSWTSGEPLFAPSEFRFTSEPGVAYLAVQDVAAPLWDALNWMVRTGEEHATGDSDAAALATVAQKLVEIGERTIVDFAACRIGRKVAEAATAAFKARGIEELFAEVRVVGAPAIARFSPAVAMYGGLAPNLTEEDVETLSDVVADAYRRRGATDPLIGLVATDTGPPVRPPHLEGSDLAVEMLEDPAVVPFVSSHVDVAGFLQEMGVAVMPYPLKTETIRGVSLAGEQLAPTIVVNTTSVYNASEHGVRFTLAHELAHLLYDRSMATSVGISSGPWAPAGIEKRANAFAAMLLMPRWLVLRAFGDEAFADPEAISRAAESLHVGSSALLEHLFALELIDEYERDMLRAHAKERLQRRSQH
ncbi:MAG TPA: ImmA/IrrE family metallo-endopeptidase [Allosphingosinicella sp.]|jgi:Zn-dependent peptidase ImmA (M78 family)